MDYFGDTTSAIDDSFGPIDVSRIGPAERDPDNPVITEENYECQGPRSGHWTVHGTAHGSAIDNGSATLYYHAKPSTSVASSHIGPLPESLVKKLGQAAERDRKLEQEIKTVGKEKEGVDVIHQGAKGATREPPRMPEGFYSPRADSYGIRIKRKDGREEVVRSPQLPITRSKTAIIDEKQITFQSAEEEPDTPNPSKPCVKSAKERSAASQSSQRITRRVRIAGRNGEETFMELPIMQSASISGSRSSSARIEYIPAKAESSRAEDRQASKAERDARAAKIAQELRGEREPSTPTNQPRTSDAVMLGALPVLSKASSVIKAASAISAKSSPQHSGSLFRDVFDTQSRPPSVASSKTSIGQSQKMSDARSVSAPSQQPSRSQSKRTSIAGWQEMGTGMLVALAPTVSNGTRSGSNRSRPKSDRIPSRSAQESTVTEELIRDDFRTPSRSASQSQHRSRESQSRPPTIYAGRGWISPHPLSVTPSEYHRSPDQAIKIPSADGKGGATITYDEWKSMRQSEADDNARRNWSRSSGGAEAYTVGTWGRRNVQDAESVRSQGSQRSYRSPTAESKHSNGTQEHDFEGVKEVGGMTQLRMP